MEQAAPWHFGPDTITWKVHVEPILVIAGFRALLLQSLHPRVMRGTYQNSELFDPHTSWARFQRTADFVAARTFGRVDEVERLGRRVRKLHASRTGYDPDKDETFRLDEPAGLLWVHCGEIDSYADIARRSGILDDAETDRYIDENRRSAAVVGLDPAEVPGSRAELDAYFAQVRPELYASTEARRALLNSVNPSVPLRWSGLRLLAPPVTTLAFASLPRWARRLFGVPLALPTTDLAVTTTLRTLRRVSLPLRRRPPVPADEGAPGDTAEE
ncbi:MAG TPA: oxygenase MpaB family protein [Actinopolymorphaceae bacterium]